MVQRKKESGVERIRKGRASNFSFNNEVEVESDAAVE